MTQAARLSLRMQKELKLLLTDPPPGSSFPSLSPDSDLYSLSSIDAQLEGPEGTVYAEGVFRIKIQIPERYPFQPPSVTFGTPIYHPNIDNGGRICLDILNLPPKGAWQPSLNISTVLTSIGLLLSEPNPDDGLMCEASREYKYNRQAFDQKARYMTQKYAKAGTTASAFNSQCMEASSTPSMMNGVQLIKETQHALSKQGAANKKLGGFTRNLSLVSSSSIQRAACGGEASDNCIPGQSDSNHDNRSDADIKKGEHKVAENDSNCKKLCGTSQDSSLGFSNISQDNHGHHKVNVKPHCQSSPNPHALPTTSGFLAVQSQDHLDKCSTPERGITSQTVEPSSDSWALSSTIIDKIRVMSQSLPSHFQTGGSSVRMPQNGTKAELDSHGDLSSIACDASADTKRKKLCLSGRKLSLGLQGSIQGNLDNKENLGPVCKLALSRSMDSSMKSSVSQKLQKSNKSDTQFSTSVSVSKHSSYSESMKLDHDQRMKLLDQDRNVRHAELLNEDMKCVEESPGLDSVIVLDSDDSEDDGNRSVVPKPMLGQQRKGNSKCKGQKV